MNKILILEGPDGSGKSTLAKKLEKRGWLLIHNDKPTVNENLLKRFIIQLIRVSQQKQNVVFDRFHLSEPIYSKAMKRKCLLNFENYSMLNQLLEICNAKVIILLPEFEICKISWENRLNTEYVQQSNVLKKIYLEYQQLLTTTPQYVKYDYSLGKRFILPSFVRKIK